MSVETIQDELKQAADGYPSDTIRKFATLAVGNLNEAIDSLQQLLAAVDRGTFDNDTGGRIERAARLAQAAAENLSPWANEITSAGPAKPR
ncbi:MAG: hypothetical protein K8T91_18215 [Planctomycetes bacterium]|nr:hypothetical protein [Planctomycetota bacterium]